MQMKIHYDRLTRLFIFLFLSTFISFNSSAVDTSDPVYAKGEKLFYANCASCHAIDKKVIGPPLKGVINNWPDREYLYKWVHNSKALIDEGYPRAVEIYAEYKPAVMTAMPQLTGEDIDAIFVFIENYVPPVNLVSIDPKKIDGAKKGAPLKMLFLVIGSLLVVALVLGKLVSDLERANRAKSGEPAHKEKKLSDIFFGRKTIIIASLVLLVYVGYKTVEAATSLGRQQGYQPVQPIKFSHELHAGVNTINCQYCHMGARQGKQAIIPSVNICMNCHTHISEGPKYGKEEIAKIYKAAGWDPDSAKYTSAPQKVEWIRIHNLPDHVYFNHQQHVVAGKVECQTCHGPVETMEEVYQYAPLSMGWCINCHRQTEVQFTSNEYYKIYHKYQEQLKSGEIQKVTVEDIGGTECQKCHY